ncbi:peptidase domain-containing ABC transporter [Crocinitomix algicola]|uniref:peptidase domain-containing ABC transporter n=1 Tax=Crocinitomix algicola TaxID=1740263 RepID=UPI0008364157|nr:peptidase domain-containing ABC transporter [Crocinitomix algicola]
MGRVNFSFYNQPDQMDCGPTCLRMIAKHYGRGISLEKLRKLSETTREGSSLKNIADTAENIGFRTIGVKVSFEKLEKDAPLPCIVHWNQYHFIVVYKIKKGIVYVADPAHGLLKYSKEDFVKNWIGNGADSKTEEGIALLMEPTPRLKGIEADDKEARKGFSFLYQYLFRYKKFMFQLFLGLLAGSLLQLIFPFLTQSVVDVGIQNQDINFIYLILIAQLFLFLGRTAIEIIRGWILLHLSTRINISLISDFFIKLMNLPIAYFDVKMTGDIMQRINDHNRIENLLTSQSLNVLFSLFNLVVFGGVLAWYDLKIFGIFLVGSLLYFIWVILFLKRRKDLDYKRFSQMSDEQSKVMELINGMQEIKLHNAEKQKRWNWEFLQARLFKISMKSLALEQTQTIGSNFINEIKNLLISIFSAKLVIDGQITLGMMMSISYIIGQLNSPIQQLIGFVYSVQDAKIALERLSEIHHREDEEPLDQEKSSHIPESSDLNIDNISFRYIGASEEVIKNLSLTIPENKITAIVGASGSGKTTLMKILLKFYEPSEGVINFGTVNLNNISQKVWREKCGVVMQEGYIFNDSIANNIAIGEDFIDQEKLTEAVEVANIKDFVESLPLGVNTKIGMDGVGMSTGQKQRLLIARAVYKNPDIICFDEATSALDAKNERIIMENLNRFFKDRTAIVIAHRLSTVKNADQIVVLDEGKIIEKGTHAELVAKKGSYYTLVKNQLELEKLNNAK